MKAVAARVSGRGENSVTSTSGGGRILGHARRINDRASERGNPRIRPRLQDQTVYVHLTHYVVVTTMLFIVNILTSTAYILAVWRALGWRGGVVSQALAIFDKVPFLTAD